MNRARLLAWSAPMLLAYGTVYGATLVVPDQFPSIQAAITSAVDGDTVLVRPGTYQEAITWAEKNLILLGEALPPSVIVTGGSSSRVMSIGPGVTQQSVIENLTIRDGLAEEGGGIKLVGSAPIIQHCRFEANVAEVPPQAAGPSLGGALFVSSGSSLLVRDCSFIQNRSLGSVPPLIEWWGAGGAVFVESGGSLDARRCRFQENEAFGLEGGVGGGICVTGVASAVIDSCIFERNGFSYGAGVYSDWQVAVRNCIFQDNAGWSGGAFAAYGPFSIENSQFFGNLTVGTPGGAIFASRTGSITNNTIAFNESWNEMAGILAPEAAFANNIICQNQGWGVIECPRDPQDFTCNDVWGNTIDGAPANYNGCDLTGMNGNISADPLFCAPQAWDLSLDANSPCAGGLNPCGLMGALDVGCGVASIKESAGAPSASIRVLSSQPVASGSDVRIVLELPDGSTGRLAVYSATGRCLAVLNRGALSRGRHEFLWRTTSQRMPSGVYQTL